MDCVLMRHGIAVERDEWRGLDAARPLTERGAKRVAQVATALKWLDIRPVYVLSSPLVRAAETAKIVHDLLEVQSAIRLIDELLPDTAPELLLSLLHKLPPESCVICVGHEPHLGMAASVMLTGKPTTAFPFKKAGACFIELPVSLKPSGGLLQWWMGPAQLRALGKSVKRIS